MTTEDLQSEKERVYKLFFEIAKSEQHFNTLQTKYRQIASLWLLGALGGIGYVLSKTKDGLYIDPFLIVIIICSIAIIGLILLWIMDLLV